jgi:2-hydroxy-6-oxonona-2,4-dienedioate hydrolase
MKVADLRRASGLVPINGAHIYYECAGEGPPFVMIHSGVSDSRQWENEFAHFAQRFRVVRFDMRGYGASEPAAGEFSHLRDLIALLEYLHIDEPLILMGCSMGGTIAMDHAVAYPTRARALIMVGSAPSGLKVDVVPTESRLRWLNRFRTRWLLQRLGALDRVAEIDTRIWFDGMGRSSAQVNQSMRKLAYDMSRKALGHESKRLGKRLPDSDVPATNRLDTLRTPVLVIVGANDLPFLLKAGEYMTQKIPSVRMALMQDAAHLPNMDHPEEFRRVVETFVADSASQ